MYFTSWWDLCQAVNIQGYSALLFVILVPSFHCSHQEVICWHPGNIYSLYYLLTLCFTVYCSILCCWQFPAWGSIKFQVIVSVHKWPSGCFSKMCRQFSNVDVWILKSLITPAAHRNGNMLRGKRNQNRGDILSAFLDWVLKRSKNVTLGCPCSNMLREILQATSLTED